MNMRLINDAVSQRITGFLGKQLPERTKRLVFLASLSALLREATSFDNETLRKLNKVMLLCTSDSAIKLPVQLSKAIWHGRTKFEVCADDLSEGAVTPARLARVAHCIINAMPAWLRYGEEKDIEKDVETLILNRSLVLG